MTSVQDSCNDSPQYIHADLRQDFHLLQHVWLMTVSEPDTAVFRIVWGKNLRKKELNTSPLLLVYLPCLCNKKCLFKIKINEQINF